MLLPSCRGGGGFIIINRQCLFLVRGRRKSFGCVIAGRLPDYHHHDGPSMTMTTRIKDCRISSSRNSSSLRGGVVVDVDVDVGATSLIDDDFTTSLSNSKKHFSSNSANTENNDKKQQKQQQQQEDLYEILGLPRQFEISSQEMKNAYRSLMNKYHPDKQQQQSSSSSSSSQEEEEEEEEPVDNDMMASQITNAYQVLKEPHTRAKHLLELVGLPLDETTQTSDGMVVGGTEFFLEVMEIREDIDSTTSDDTNKLQGIQNNINMKISNVINELNDAFDNTKDYNKATKLTSQLQYLRRMQTAIHEKMDLL